MTDEIRPLEETAEVADAVADDVAVDAFITGGGPDARHPAVPAARRAAALAYRRRPAVGSGGPGRGRGPGPDAGEHRARPA